MTSNYYNLPHYPIDPFRIVSTSAPEHQLFVHPIPATIESTQPGYYYQVTAVSNSGPLAYLLDYAYPYQTSLVYQCDEDLAVIPTYITSNQIASRSAGVYVREESGWEQSYHKIYLA